MCNTPNETTCSDDNQQVKLETLSQIAAFINDGGGTFRKLLEYIKLDYCDAYEAGGMVVSNALHRSKTVKDDPVITAISREFDTIHTMLDGIRLRLDNLENK